MAFTILLKFSVVCNCRIQQIFQFCYISCPYCYFFLFIFYRILLFTRIPNTPLEKISLLTRASSKYKTVKAGNSSFLYEIFEPFFWNKTFSKFFLLLYVHIQLSGKERNTKHEQIPWLQLKRFNLKCLSSILFP